MSGQNGHKIRWDLVISTLALLTAIAGIVFSMINPIATEGRIATAEEAINGLDRRVELLEGDMRDKD